jgi:hypothetical protein
MKINRTLTQQTLKELSKSIAEIAKLLGEDAAGIECKRIKVEKSTDEHDVYHVDINIRLSLVDGAGEIEDIDLL